MLSVMIIMEPLDRTNPVNSGLMKRGMDSVKSAKVSTWEDGQVTVAFGKVNLTPDYPMPMAGYAPRDAFTSVHDSLYCRVLLIKKGSLDLFLVSADLLIFPDQLRDRIVAAFQKDLNTKFFFSATHTHSGLGGWAEGIGGELIAGSYHPEWLDNVAGMITQTMNELKSEAIPASLDYFEADASEYVMNRLVPGGDVDGYIRGLKFRRQSGDSVVLFSYSGHPTLIGQQTLELSNDYPGATMELLENRGYTFAMFMAGMVGSHRITNIGGKGYPHINKLASILSSKIIESRAVPLDTGEISFLEFNIPFRRSQVRLMKGLVLRDWVFSEVLQPLKGTMSMLSIGDLNFVSTPCDFSGELYGGINNSHKPAMITSFNGDYVGYITKDAHYDQSDYMEVMTMNWVGPFYGNYFTSLINAGLDRLP